MATPGGPSHQGQSPDSSPSTGQDGPGPGPAGSAAAAEAGSAAPDPRPATVPVTRPRPIGGLRAPASWIESEWDDRYTEHFKGGPPHGVPSLHAGPRAAGGPPWNGSALRELVGATGATPTARRRWGPDRGTGLIVVVIVAVLVAVAGIILTATFRADEAASSGKPGVAPAASPGTSSGDSSGDSSGASNPPADGTVPQGLSPVTPAPVVPDGGGTAVTASVGSGDLLDVYEVVSWPGGGPAELTLELPDLAEVSRIDRAFAPVVSDLQVTVDGNPVDVLPEDGSTTRWSVRSPSGGAPNSMEVRYLLAGAIVRSVPSATGRGLAVLSPITHGLGSGRPVRVEMAGDGVLAMACPGAPDVSSQVCGRKADERWIAEPPPSGPPVVVVQLDLPPLP